jgi:hypothetical protein
LYGNFQNSYMLKHWTLIWWYLQDLPKSLWDL